MIPSSSVRCVQSIRNSAHSSLAQDLEINKAVTYLRMNDVGQAVDVLKSCDEMTSSAATNLSFIYFLVSLDDCILNGSKRKMGKSFPVWVFRYFWVDINTQFQRYLETRYLL